MEQYVRTKIDTQLTNLGWILNGNSRNVFLEEARTKEEKKILGGKRPDYVLYSSDYSLYEPLAIIEAKSSKTKGLDGAIEQACDYAYKLNAPFIFATDGTFLKTFHVKENSALKFNGEEVNSFLKEDIAQLFRLQASVDIRPVEVIKSLDSLIEDFSDINDLLRKQGLTAGYQRFSEFTTILFLKLFSDRETYSKKPQISEIQSWDYLSKIQSKDYLNYIQTVIFPAIKNLYGGDDIFPEKLEITDSGIFKQIYDKISPLQLTYINEDVKGAAFEYFLANSPSADKDLGEYFTPRHVVKMLVTMLDPQLGEKIYDPFCGTGGMLIEAFKHIKSNMEQTDINKTTLEKHTIYGRELTSNARIAKMNMILAGDGHTEIKKCDSLSPENIKEVEDKFDIVISNFPFSQQTDYKNFYDVPTNSGDSICLQHCLKALKENGRMGLVVPEGLLFKKEHTKTRNYLFENCHVEYVISLPQGVFLPYTPSKTSILFCRMGNPNGKTWFYDVKNDGFSLNNHRWKEPGRSDLDKFLSFRNVSDADKETFGFMGVDYKTIAENQFILWSQRYTVNEDIAGETMALDDVIDVVCGNRITQKNDRGTKYPVYGGGGVSFYTDSTNAEDCIVISRFAMSEKCVRYVKEPFWLLDSGFTVSIKKDQEDRFSENYLFYVLQSIQNKIFLCGRGIGQKNIDFELFNSIKIPVLQSKQEQEIFVKEILKQQDVINMHEAKIAEIKETISRSLKGLSKPLKGLSDTELASKYEAGAIDLKNVVYPMLTKPKN
jgi:type I restriction enzyme M protein